MKTRRWDKIDEMKYWRHNVYERVSFHPILYTKYTHPFCESQRARVYIFIWSVNMLEYLNVSVCPECVIHTQSAIQEIAWSFSNCFHQIILSENWWKKNRDKTNAHSHTHIHAFNQIEGKRSCRWPMKLNRIKIKMKTMRREEDSVCLHQLLGNIMVSRCCYYLVRRFLVSSVSIP